MKTYKKHLHNLYLQVNEDIMDMLEEDESYSAMLTDLTNYQEQLDLAIRHCNQEVKVLLNNFRSLELKMNAREKEEMYIKGYKDCLKLIQILASQFTKVSKVIIREYMLCIFLDNLYLVQYHFLIIVMERC